MRLRSGLADDARRTTGADTIRILPLRAEYVRPAANALAASLADDPANSYALPDPDRRERALRSFLSAPVRDALPFNTASVAVAGTEVIGAAVWLPPRAYPWSLTRKLRAARAFLPVLLAAPRSLPALMRLGANVERAFPDAPVWYLEVVGIRPGAQRRGIGTRLLQPGLARADADRLPCYLETPRPENIPFYERLGFRVEREGIELLPGGPTHWTMARKPARKPGTASGLQAARRRIAPM
jgi:GNAT superfamily N-acetyltransferase